MEFRRLTEGGSDLYQRAMELYEISFPVFEQREPESQIEIMGHEEYRFHLIYDEETWVGIDPLLGNRRLYIHRTFLHPAAAAKPGIRTADAGTSQRSEKDCHSRDRSTGG